jgi:hypothetical protein
MRMRDRPGVGSRTCFARSAIFPLCGPVTKMQLPIARPTAREGTARILNADKKQMHADARRSHRAASKTVATHCISKPTPGILQWQ